MSPQRRGDPLLPPPHPPPLGPVGGVAAPSIPWRWDRPLRPQRVAARALRWQSLQAKSPDGPACFAGPHCCIRSAIFPKDGSHVVGDELVAVPRSELVEPCGTPAEFVQHHRVLYECWRPGSLLEEAPTRGPLSCEPLVRCRFAGLFGRCWSLLARWWGGGGGYLRWVQFWADGRLWDGCPVSLGR